MGEFEALSANGSFDESQKMELEKPIKTRLEEEITRHTAAAFAKKIGKNADEVTFRDVVMLYVPKSLPLYDSNGFPL